MRANSLSNTKITSSNEIDHPHHYTSHPSGVECIDIAEHMSFNLGNAIKYIWRAGLKSPDVIKDLAKAHWYIGREMKRLKCYGQEALSEEQRAASPAAKD